MHESDNSEKCEMSEQGSARHIDCSRESRPSRVAVVLAGATMLVVVFGIVWMQSAKYELLAVENTLPDTAELEAKKTEAKRRVGELTVALGPHHPELLAARSAVAGRSPKPLALTVRRRRPRRRSVLRRRPGTASRPASLDRSAWSGRRGRPRHPRRRGAHPAHWRSGRSPA